MYDCVLYTVRESSILECASVCVPTYEAVVLSVFEGSHHVNVAIGCDQYGVQSPVTHANVFYLETMTRE